MKTIEVKEREKYTLWRRRNRVRLCDVAQYCKVSIPLLSMWENGKTEISNKVLSKYNEYIEQFEKGKIYATNE
jgi:transcriptional regulator with XRE-family HTH domain